jgi:hypothetical protein
MHVIHGMEIKAKKDEVLKALRANRETHAKIVSEAKAGYADKAAALLREKLALVEASKGAFVEALVFSIPLPKDHTKAYDVVIKMLELSTSDEVELTAEQVRHFVMDDWDWKDAFIGSNKMYSATAAAME